LYHSGNGITVEREKVETYLSPARSLFESLFQEDLTLLLDTAQPTGVGTFMETWIQLERLQRDSERRRHGSATELDPDFSRRAAAWEFARIGLPTCSRTPVGSETSGAGLAARIPIAQEADRGRQAPDRSTVRNDDVARQRTEAHRRRLEE
jgi:hypothetical protein